MVGGPQHLLSELTIDMRLANRSALTISQRVGAVRRLAAYLAPVDLLDATPDMLVAWQRAIAALAPATVNIYTRHVREFYRWALMRGHIDTDPSVGLIVPTVRRGKPHPTDIGDLRTVLACARGGLRTTYALAAFAGMRCAEIAGLQSGDVEVGAESYALVHGKGRKDRLVPLVQPLVDELRPSLRRAGPVVRRDDGRGYDPKSLSVASLRFLRSIGVVTTLHSMRHAFATSAYRATRDLLMVADLLGHASVATTQIYAEPDMGAALVRLQPVADIAASVLTGRHLRVVG